MKKTNKQKNVPVINNLEDLRNAKRKLKLQMKMAEKKHENSFVNKAVSMVNSLRSDSSFTSTKVEDTLNWVGEKASQKYPMKGFSKILISGLVMIAVPIITSKIQDYLEDKF